MLVFSGGNPRIGISTWIEHDFSDLPMLTIWQAMTTVAFSYPFFTMETSIFRAGEKALKKLSKRDGSTEVTSARLSSSFRENGWTTLGIEGPGPLFNTLPRHCKLGTYPINTPCIRCIGGCPHPKGFPILLMISLLLQDFHMLILYTCKVWWGYELLNSWPRVT